MGNTIAIILQSDRLQWYKSHSDRLFNALFSRLAGEEVDPYPGHARWHGDGIPGMQIIWNAPSSKIGLLSVGRGSGQRLSYAKDVSKNANSEENKVALLKALAKQLGYTITKKKSNKRTANKQGKRGPGRPRKNPSKE